MDEVNFVVTLKVEYGWFYQWMEGNKAQMKTLDKQAFCEFEKKNKWWWQWYREQGRREKLPKWVSDQFSCSVVSNSLQFHGLQHASLPCPSPTPRTYSNLCPSSWWCHTTISSSVIPFSSCPQSFPASGTFQMSQLFASDGQRIGVSASASALPYSGLNIEYSGLISSGLTGLLSLHSKALSRVFSNTTVQKHQFFGTQLSLQSNSHIHTWLL